MAKFNNNHYQGTVHPLPEGFETHILNIPVIKRDEIDISKLNNGLCLINMKNASRADKHPEVKIVHSFDMDNELMKVLSNPITSLIRMGRYYAVSSLDISIDPRMNCTQVLISTYLNRWWGVFLQSYGVPVIPCVGWALEDTYDICFAGIEPKCTLMISTLGVGNKSSAPIFLRGFHELRKRFPDSQIICVGDRVNGMDTDVCFVKFEDSFGYSNFYHSWFQPCLFSWDWTPYKED